MKVSKDQNLVEIKGVKGKFVESKSICCCGLCCFGDRDCEDLPCGGIGSFREDGQNGYFEFEEVKE